MNVLPDVPAIAEFLPGYEATSWTGVGAPRGTPADIVEQAQPGNQRGARRPRIQRDAHRPRRLGAGGLARRFRQVHRRRNRKVGQGGQVRESQAGIKLDPSVSCCTAHAARGTAQTPWHSPWPRRFRTAGRSCRRSIRPATRTDKARRSFSPRGARRGAKNAPARIGSDGRGRLRRSARPAPRCVARWKLNTRSRLVRHDQRALAHPVLGRDAGRAFVGVAVTATGCSRART